MKERNEIFITLVTMLYDMDLSDVAQASGVSYSTLWQWCYGSTVAPRISTLIKVANYLGFDFYLLPAAGQKSKRRLKAVA